MKKRLRKLFWLMFFIIVFAGFEVKYSEHKALVANVNIYRDWVIAGKYKRTYYDVSLLVEEGKIAREVVIEDKEIANNFWKYFGEYVKVKRKTLSWYGKFERRYTTVKDYSLK